MSKVFLVTLMSFVFVVHAQEFVMVWSKEVDLYNKDGKITKRLNHGDIVQVEQFEKDASHYLIKISGEPFNAKKHFFKSVAEVVTSYKKRILEHEAEINKGKLRLSNIESDLTVRQVQALELRRDTALSYMTVSNYVNNNGVPMRTFSSIMNEGQYKKLMKTWAKDVEELSQEKNKLQDKESSLLTEINNLQEKINSFENLGELVKATNERQGTQLIVIKDTAQLYVENKVIKNVVKGDVLMGKSHPKFDGWYEISLPNDPAVYVISGQAIMKKSEYVKALKNNIQLANSQIDRLNKEVEKQQFALKLYQGISRQLEADKFLQGGYGLVKNLVVPIDNERTFTIKRPNAEDVYVNSFVAEKVLKEWKQEILAMSGASLKNQQKVLDLKKQLIDMENSLKTLNR